MGKDIYKITNEETLKPTTRTIYAVVGRVDIGKSTFISDLVKAAESRDLPVDSLCEEHTNERTIRSAQILVRHKGKEYVFIDCPGHIDEYPEEIMSGLSVADFILWMSFSMDDSMDEYEQGIRAKFTSLTNKPFIRLFPRQEERVLGFDHYLSSEAKYRHILNSLPRSSLSNERAIQRAYNTTALALKRAKKPVVFLSGGKDSVVLTDIVSKIDKEKKVTYVYPISGYDVKELNAEFFADIKNHFGIDIKTFNILPEDFVLTEDNVTEAMLTKAKLLTDYINENEFDFAFTGIRRDEEGIRSKEKFFSPRSKKGKFSILDSQIEIFGEEDYIVDIADKTDIGHWRVSPLLDMTELDIWKYTLMNNLPVCNAYFDDGTGNRYRSLGDYPITDKTESKATTIQEIIEEIVANPQLTERMASRSKQDKHSRYAMEDFRKEGFF